MDMGVRLDGRTAQQLRPPSIEWGPIQRADGSARFALGATAAIAAVYGPEDPKYASSAIPDRAYLEVVVRPRSGMAGMTERAMEAHIRQVLEPITVLEELPRLCIHVVVKDTNE